MRALVKAVLLVLIDATLGSNGSLSQAMKSSVEHSWLSYRVPMVNAFGRVCCSDWNHGRKQKIQTMGCNLDSDNEGTSTDKQVPGDDTLLIFLRMKNGTVEKVKAFSTSCQVELGAAKVNQIDNVTSQESLALLETLVTEKAMPMSSQALLALSLHADNATTDALQRLAVSAPSTALRQNALYWLVEARGTDGFERASGLFAKEKSNAVRQQAVFALSRGPESQRDEVLVRIAKSDADAQVRSQALFWLAEIESPQALAAIDDAMKNDRASHVREQSVFALSRLPDGTEALERLANDSGADKRLRKQALFWLAHADNDSSLGAFDRMLAKPVR